MTTYLVVMAGAGLGGLARYVVGNFLTATYGERFPVGTLFVNVSGCFLIGLLMTLLTERWQLNPHWRLFLVVGFLGGYTTFSTFGYETWLAVRGGVPGIALLNALASVVSGYLAVRVGVLIAGWR